MKRIILALTGRLKIYLNYGAVSFIVIILLLELGEELMFVLPLLFNLILFLKFDRKEKAFLLIGLFAGLLTTALFWLQYAYRSQQDWSCLFGISDWSANISYASTMLLFSIIFWEVGMRLRKNG